MVDIFDEVEEDLREERMQQFLKKYAGVLVGGCFLVVAASAGWKSWEWKKTQRDIEAASLYLAGDAVVERPGPAGPDLAAASAAFDAVSTAAPAGYRLLALLRAAALHAEAGDLPGASARWDQVSADTSADPLLRDLASLNWCIYHADQADPAVLEGRLTPLAAPGGAWRALAQEQLALLELRQGHDEAAKARLKKLAEDSTAPNDVRSRVAMLMSRMGE